MPIENRAGCIVITGENSIRYAQLVATRGALKLQLQGSSVRRGYNPAKVIAQLLKLPQKHATKKQISFLLEKFDAYIAAEYPNARSAQ